MLRTLKKYILPLLASWCLGGSMVFADQLGGQRPSAYLEIGAGGAPNAMGGAAAAQRGDISSCFWNPAGLTGSRGFQVEMQHSLLPLNQELDYIGFSSEFRQQLFYGLTFLYYSAGSDLEARSGPSMNPDSLFGDTEMTYMASLAAKMDPRWALGANLKVFINKLNTVSGIGFGGDMGLQCRVSNNTTLGFVAQDLYSFLGYSNTGAANEVFPTTLKAGISQRDSKAGVKGDFDLEWSADIGFKPRAGFEWKPVEFMALRSGFWYEINTASADFSLGIGILIPGAGNLTEFDYTLLGDRGVAGDILHQFALTGKFL